MMLRFSGHGFRHLSFGLFRGPVSDSGVDPPPVIVVFDIREQCAFGILAGRPLLLVGEFALDGMEEAFMGALS
jgi:hypothetical protein